MKRFAGAAFWTFFDQAVCSLGTAVLSILMGRSVAPREFGAFGIAFLVYTLMVGLSRAVVTDPMIVMYSGRAAPERRDAIGTATALAMGLGFAAGAVTASIGLVFGFDTTLGAALVVLGASLPGLLQQDAWRYAFFMSQDARTVAANDTLRTLVMGGLLAMYLTRDLATVPNFILAWGFSAYVGCFLGVLQSRIAPRTRGSAAWLAGHRDLAMRLGADFGINQGAANGAGMAVGPVSSLAAVGALNASRTLLGPLALLYSGTTAIVLPAMSARALQSLLRLAAWVSLVLSGTAVVWTLFLLVMPQAWGLWLLRDNWAGAHATILPTGLGSALIALAVGPNLGLKARSLGGAVLRVTAVQAPLLVVLGVGGAALGDAVGAAWGFAAAQAVGVTLTWRAFRSAEARHRAAGGPGSGALGGSVGAGTGPQPAQLARAQAGAPGQDPGREDRPVQRGVAG